MNSRSCRWSVYGAEGSVGQGSFETADEVAGVGDGFVEALEPVAEGVVVDQVGPRRRGALEPAFSMSMPSGVISSG